MSSKVAVSTRSDVEIEDGGSVVLLRPLTPEAVVWVNENIGQDNGYQPYWPVVVVERRYVPDILEGMQADGLTF
jgi:hypothetical protein